MKKDKISKERIRELSRNALARGIKEKIIRECGIDRKWASKHMEVLT